MNDSTVYIVDDDPAVRNSLSLLVNSAGFNVAAYGSAQAFLEHYDHIRPGCLVLDMNLPDLSGMDVLKQLAKRQLPLSVIILTGHGDIPAAVQAMKVGATDYIQKPFDPEQLLKRIQETVDDDHDRRRRAMDHHALATRVERLTPREREIMDMIVAGKTNKVIAIELNISESNCWVLMHRARMRLRKCLENHFMQQGLNA